MIKTFFIRRIICTNDPSQDMLQRLSESFDVATKQIIK